MQVNYRTLNNGKIEASIEGNYITGIGATKEDARANLIKWLDIARNIKWIDAFTGKEVK